MYQIDVITAASSLPTPAAAGTPGYFTDGNPGTGTPATIVPADFLNAVQAELLNLLSSAGITPSKTNRTQVLAAIKAVTTGRLLNVQTFTSSGTYTPTAGTTSVVVEVQGAGGAGGGTPACDATHAAVGGGGGSGAYAKARMTSGFSGATVTVGAGGTSVLNANGNAGGTSSFGTVSAPGGGGGSASPTQYNVFPAITGSGMGGAVATNGNLINAAGQTSIQGFIPSVSQGRSGAGAPSQFGGGGLPVNGSVSGSGIAAQTYGSGGSGSLTLGGGAAAAGGNGANGVVIVWEYA